jgi:phosphoribosylformylglycinamidine synthase
MLGIMEDKNNHMTLNFKEAGDVIYLVGEAKDCIGSSEYVKRVHEVKKSKVPHFDLDTEFKVQRAISDLIKSQLVVSAHDISEGGLFTCLLESAMTSNLGFVVDTDPSFRKDAYLFGEAQSRVVVSVKADKVSDFENQLGSKNVMFSKLGLVSNGDLAIDGQDYGLLSDWSALYNETIEKKLEN